MLAGRAPAKPPKAPTPWAWTAGKAPVPQETAQTHWPACRLPVPCWTEPVAAAPAADEAAEDAAGAAAAGGAAAVPLPVMALPAPVPFCAMAMAWNMAWVLSAVGLMEKVMPLPQWPCCLQ